MHLRNLKRFLKLYKMTVRLKLCKRSCYSLGCNRMLKKFDSCKCKIYNSMETKMALTKDEEADEVDVTPKTSHLNAMKRIFKYLKGKPNLGLRYPRESSFDLEALSDSDYARTNLDRKSTTSGCQFLRSRLILWQCKKQTIVATSTIEAEYVEAHNEDTQRNLKFTSEDQVRGGLLGIIVNRLKSGSYRVKSGRHRDKQNAGNYDIPLYSRFKQVEYKGVPHPLSGDYTPREQEDIDDSLYEYGKYGLISPQFLDLLKSDASSNVYSTCQSNDSDGEQGTVSDHSVNDDPIPIPSIEQDTIATQKTQPQMPKPTQTVDLSCAQHVKTPRQPIRTPVTPSPIPSYNRQNWNQGMQRDLGTGYSFERKPCFVCGSLSHLIKDCDYYEKKMAREAAFKSHKERFFMLMVRQDNQPGINLSESNKANQFTPRPVQLNNIRPTT
ncbi:hypothetical protein Tco_0315777 [Tanacetum coccineum]